MTGVARPPACIAVLGVGVGVGIGIDLSFLVSPHLQGEYQEITDPGFLFDLALDQGNQILFWPG
jgi:hypothetical protein